MYTNRVLFIRIFVGRPDFQFNFFASHLDRRRNEDLAPGDDGLAGPLQGLDFFSSLAPGRGPSQGRCLWTPHDHTGGYFLHCALRLLYVPISKTKKGRTLNNTHHISHENMQPDIQTMRYNSRAVKIDILDANKDTRMLCGIGCRLQLATLLF